MVDPILQKLYKGEGLAARNMGLGRKRQMQQLLEMAKRQALEHKVKVPAPPS